MSRQKTGLGQKKASADYLLGIPAGTHLWTNGLYFTLLNLESQVGGRT